MLPTKSVDNPVINLSQFPLTTLPLWSEVKLINNWPTFLQDNSRLPETVDEAVDRLMVILDGEQKIAIAVLPEEDLIDLHFRLGIAIRNAFGLHKQGSKLLASCSNNEIYNSVHSDDASGVIIQALWTKLTQENQ
jgi:hypothetical protein